MPTLVTRGAASVRGFGFAGTSPVLADPYFNYTTLLLHGNGTNGGQNNTFLDSSSNNFTITRNGNTTQGTFSPFSQTGWSNYFGSGGASYLIANATDTSKFAFGTGDFTIEFWMYAEALTAPSGLVTFYDQRAASTDGVCPTIYYYSDQLLVLVQSTNVIYGSSLSLNQWTHIALSRVSGNSRLFVNGVQTGSTYSDSNNYVAPSSDIRIFANAYGGSRSPTGYCSNFRVVKGTGLYSANFTPPTSPLTAITNTQLLTCQSNRFVDNSSNALTVTPYNTPSVQAFSPFAPTAAYSASTVGGSGYFDGNGDYLSTPDADALDLSTGDFTIQGWIYALSDAADLDGIVGKRSSSVFDGWRIAFDVTSSVNKIDINHSGDGTERKTPAINKNEWVHFAFTRTSGTLRCYANGVLGDSVAGYTYDFSNTYEVVIGTNAPGNNLDFPGYITGVQILKGTSLYSGSTYTVPTSPPTNITNTSLLLNFTNAAIIDNTAKNVLETVGNAQISTTQSKFGGASMAFDGSGDFVQTFASSPNLQFGTGDFTVEGWVYFNASGQHGILQISTNPGGFNTSNTNSIAVQRSATGQWEIYAKNSNPQASATINQSQWYHFAVVRSGTTTTFYVDGVATITVTSDSTNYTGSYIGLGAIYSTAVPLNGYIDDLRITKGIARYTSNFTPQTSQWQDQ
jgi:hypothetical protein